MRSKRARDGAQSDEPAPSGARERIVAGAYRVLAAQGYAAASVKEIARAADVAPGLVHYYFETKEELLLEVVREVCRRFHTEMNRAPLPESADALAMDRLQWARTRVRENPDWYRLLYDLYAVALRDPKLAIEVARMNEEFKTNLQSEIERVIERFDVNPGVSTKGIASVYLASLQGLAMQALIDPSFDFEGGHDALLSMSLGFVSGLPKR